MDIRNLFKISSLTAALFLCMGTRAQSEPTTGDLTEQSRDWKVSKKEREIFRKDFSKEPRARSKDTTEYEILVFDPNFNYWLQSIARPRGYYSQTFMEQRNLILVNEWNLRFQTDARNGDLYGNRIDYRAGVDYGYEVNYILYNYFLYFQRRNGIRLTTLRPDLN